MPTPPIPLATLANGDTNYVAELNANFAALAATLASVQGQLNNLPAVQSIQLFLQAMLGSTNTFLGVSGLETTVNGPILTVSAGFVWAAQSVTVLQLSASTSQDMTGFNPGAWFVCMDASGNVGVFSSSTGVLSLYSFIWDGTAISSVTNLCARAALVAL